MILFPLLLALASDGAERGRARVHELRNRLGMPPAEPGQLGGLAGRMAWIDATYGPEVGTAARSLVLLLGGAVGSELPQPPMNKLAPWIGGQMARAKRSGQPMLTQAIRAAAAEVLDWLRTDPSADLGNRSFDEAVAASRAWFSSHLPRATGVQPGTVVYQWPDGSRVERLDTRGQLEDEGRAMRHCVGAKWQHDAVRAGQKLVLSLRSPVGQPLVTISLRRDANAWFVGEVSGPGNLEPEREAEPYVDELLLAMYAAGVRPAPGQTSRCAVEAPPDELARIAAIVPRAALHAQKLSQRARALLGAMDEARCRAIVDAEPRLGFVLGRQPEAPYNHAPVADQAAWTPRLIQLRLYYERRLYDQLALKPGQTAHSALRPRHLMPDTNRYLERDRIDQIERTLRDLEPDLAGRARQLADAEAELEADVNGPLAAAAQVELRAVDQLFERAGWQVLPGPEWSVDRIWSRRYRDPPNLGNIDVEYRQPDGYPLPIWDHVISADDPDLDTDSALDSDISMVDLLMRIGTLRVTGASIDPENRAERPEPGRWIDAPNQSTQRRR